MIHFIHLCDQLLSFFHEKGKELFHGSPLFDNLPLRFLFRLGSLIYQLVIWDVVDLHVKHVYQLFDKRLWVKFCEQYYHVGQRHFVFFEYFFGNSVSALNDKIVEAFFLLQSNILLGVKSTGRTFQVVFK